MWSRGEGGRVESELASPAINLGQSVVCWLHWSTPWPTVVGDWHGETPLRAVTLPNVTYHNRNKGQITRKHNRMLKALTFYLANHVSMVGQHRKEEKREICKISKMNTWQNKHMYHVLYIKYLPLCLVLDKSTAVCYSVTFCCVQWFLKHIPVCACCYYGANSTQRVPSCPVLCLQCEYALSLPQLINLMNHTSHLHKHPQTSLRINT